MKKRFFLGLLAILLCLSLTGCKSNDYKKAVSLEEAGDFSAALEVYESISNYKDSRDHIAVCRAAISAIEEYEAATKEYEAAKAIAEGKNAALDLEISGAEGIIAEGRKAFDDALIPAFETVISEAKAAKISISEIPSTTEEINKSVNELNSINYDEIVEKLHTQQDALETSIKQYSLVDAPSEAYIIQCLSRIPNIIDISAVTEDNDPNGHLNKAGGYTAQVYFTSDLVNQGLVYGNTVIEKGTDGGGSIEVYVNVQDAEKRNDYLATFDGTVFASGSHTVVGTILVRTSDKLTASQQKEMEANIIAELINIENF